MEKADFLFAELEYITDDKGFSWIPASALAEKLGIKNMSRAIASAGLEPHEYMNIKPSAHPQLQAENYKQSAVRIMFISEPGAYKLAFASGSAKAGDLRKWVFERVLPALAGTGEYNHAEDIKDFLGQERETPDQTEARHWNKLPTDERGRVNIGTPDFPMFVDPSPRSSSQKK